MRAITEQELPTKYIRNKRERVHLLVITNSDYVTQLLKTLHMWYVTVLKCQQDIIYPYAMTKWENIIHFSYTKALPWNQSQTTSRAWIYT